MMIGRIKLCDGDLLFPSLLQFKIYIETRTDVDIFTNKIFFQKVQYSYGLALTVFRHSLRKPVNIGLQSRKTLYMFI